MSKLPVVRPDEGVTPDYWDEACRHLIERDRVLSKLIPEFGEARLQSRGDAFTTLVRSVIGQQISVKAAQSVWQRLADALGAGAERCLSPQGVLAQPVEALRQVGLSVRKSEYLLDLARHFAEGPADAVRIELHPLHRAGQIVVQRLAQPPVDDCVHADPPPAADSPHAGAARVLEENWTGTSTVPSICSTSAVPFLALSTWILLAPFTSAISDDPSCDGGPS